jgi:hypothetical protein
LRVAHPLIFNINPSFILASSPSFIESTLNCVACLNTWQESIDTLNWYNALLLFDGRKDAVGGVIEPYLMGWVLKNNPKDFDPSDRPKDTSELLRVMLKRIAFAVFYLNRYDKDHPALLRLKRSEPQYVLMADFLELWIYKLANGSI